MHSILQSYLKARSDEVDDDEAAAAILGQCPPPPPAPSLLPHTDRSLDWTALDLPPYTGTGTGTLAPYQAKLLAITHTYWTLTCLSLSPSDRATLGGRLVDITNMDTGEVKRVPIFTGEEVEEGGEGGKKWWEEDGKKVEAIMRVGGFLLVGVGGGEVVGMWRELGETVAGLWEVEDEE